MNAKPSVLDAIKIQARAVIPIVKALERELGKERAHTIVGNALADDYARWQARRIPARNVHPRETSGANTFPVESITIDDTEISFGVNTQTLMKGAPYCDFRWRLRGGAAS